MDVNERSEAERAFEEATRNIDQDTVQEICKNPRDDEQDSPLVRYAKACYRRLAEATAGVTYEGNGMLSHPV